MTTCSDLRVRVPIQDLQRDYERGTKKPLEALMRAWKGIKELDPEDPRSFFKLAGYHGAPFRGAGWGSADYWGGYCNHGNILFPTWHRVYLLKLEDALRSIPGCEDVTLPYWDETAADSLRNGIPWALTDKTFVLDGKTIENPLRSFVFPRKVADHVGGGDPVDYTKDKEYETVRYPLSGLVGTPEARDATAKHNAQFPEYEKNVRILDQNVIDWLTTYIVVKGEKIPTNVAKKFHDCLSAPNYTVFSNTTSAAAWNDNPQDGKPLVVSLESPHNSIHLAVGGCEVPHYNRSPIPNANGDMGENDTAGFDPIFFFHHCFIDMVFWLWQQRHNATEALEVIDQYPGTNSVDGQNPTPGTVPNSWLTLDSPLDPFKKEQADGKQRPYTSRDCVHIEKQLGYTYRGGSLQEMPGDSNLKRGKNAKTIRVTGVNRAPIAGSFLVSAFLTIDGQEHHIGTEAVLSRWHVAGCANCQTHLEVKAVFPLDDLDIPMLQNATLHAEVIHRSGTITSTQPVTLAAGAAAGAAIAVTAEAGAATDRQRRIRISVE